MATIKNRPQNAPAAKGATPPPLDEAKDEPQATHLVVAAKRDGFRRAGRAWSTTPTRVAIDEFSDEEIEQLWAETMLDVVFESDSQAA